MFWVAFGVLCGTAVAYVLWASGEVQPFNDPVQLTDEEKARKKAEKLKAKQEYQ